MHRKETLLLLLGLLLCSFSAQAKLSVFTCEPEWKALAEQIGGNQVTVFSATTAQQDPHHIQARPSLIAKLRRADLLICTGAELEAGWLPLLLRRARNAKVQSGRDGHLMVADHLSLMEKPTRLDRSEGDVHAQGNPHFHLDPRRLLKAARVLALRLTLIDSENSKHYQERLASFQQQWNQAISRWEASAASLHGKSVVVHHREWIYLLDWLGMKRLAALEPKPGVPPSAGHLASLQSTLKGNPTLAIIRAMKDGAGPSEWLAKRTGVPAVSLPYTVGSTEHANSLQALFDEVVKQLVELKK
ncbi:MAG: zinc ABC transporter solute-binding protein [Gammaproteobacteria bacterium]|nr:zinc ABC transporter solute-binding protein [Gammaproteobacteria bacterium]